MSKEQIGLRLLSSEAGVPGHILRSGMLSEKNMRELSNAASRLAESPIYIDDTPGLDPLEMRAKARRLKMEVGLDMIMVDYLQLMSVKGKVESRQQEISQISRGLKSIAKELDMPVIALSQLSRRPEQRTGDHRPNCPIFASRVRLNRMRTWSVSSIATSFTTRDGDKNIAEIIIAKQRNGPIGDFKLVFHNDTTTLPITSRSPTTCLEVKRTNHPTASCRDRERTRKSRRR